MSEFLKKKVFLDSADGVQHLFPSVALISTERVCRLLHAVCERRRRLSFNIMGSGAEKCFCPLTKSSWLTEANCISGAAFASLYQHQLMGLW